MSYIDGKYRTIVGTAAASTAGVGIPGLFVPGLDEAGVATAWTAMIIAIANESGHKMDRALAAKLVGSALGAVAGYKIGSKILTWAFAPLVVAFPVAGVPAVVALNAGLNALFTLRLGAACAKEFSRPDFTSDDVMLLAHRVGSFLLGLPHKEEIALVRAFLARA